MASAENQTATLLLAYAPLLALVPAERITPDEIPQDVDIKDGPAICFERGNTDTTYGLLGDERLAAKVTMSITVWAKSRSMANSVANRIREAMQQEQNEQVAQSSTYEPELEEYSAVVAFEVWELD